MGGGASGSLDHPIFLPFHPVSILALKDSVGALDRVKAGSKAGRMWWVWGGSGSRESCNKKRKGCVKVGLAGELCLGHQDGVII